MMNFNNRHTTIQEIENNVSQFLLSLVIQFNISEPTVVNFIMPYVDRMSSVAISVWTSKQAMLSLLNLSISRSPIVKKIA